MIQTEQKLSKVSETSLVLYTIGTDMFLRIDSMILKANFEAKYTLVYSQLEPNRESLSLSLAQYVGKRKFCFDVELSKNDPCKPKNKSYFIQQVLICVMKKIIISCLYGRLVVKVL